ncbi:MAG TPA: tripartite tricarboxylate transporter substrate binding protein [Ramlibacter sp.]|nr:tripartite tricarboxylate transporter substrate binding protein [Ramlibacter sp.]
MKNTLRGLLLAISVSAACLCGVARAQTYPTKPISIVVPFAPGAGSDLIARLLAQKLAARIGQPVVVQNRAGASGIIGARFVAGAPADGYTLLYTPSSFAFVQFVVKTEPSVSYDPLNGFTPIIEAGRAPVFLVTSSTSGFKTFQEAALAAKTTRLAYGSAGTGSILHIIGEVVNKATGVDFAHIPYKGVAPAIQDVLGGQIPFAYGSLSTIKPFMASGKLLPLAVTTRDRSKFAPEVPSLNELGYKGLDLGSWNGLLGPKGMPAVAVKTLNMHLNEILKMPDVIERMASEGASPVGGPPEKFGETIAVDHSRFGKMIKELNITAN